MCSTHAGAGANSSCACLGHTTHITRQANDATYIHMPALPSTTIVLLGIGYDPILLIHTHANEKQRDVVSGQYATAVERDYALNSKVLGD